MRKLLIILFLLASVRPVAAQQPTPVQQVPARLDAAAQIATTASSATTLTLTPNGGETVYVYEVDVQNCDDATGATAAATTNITTSNLTGSPIWIMQSGSATASSYGPGGCLQSFSINYPGGLKATAIGTPVTFVTPTFATHQTIRINIAWRSGPVQ